MSTFARGNYWRWAALVSAVCLGAQPSMAQDARDPTVPPLAAHAEAAPQGAARPPLDANGLSVIVRDGKPGLVVGTRVVMPGQRVGALTLERITETEVWLRDGKDVRKLSRFSGIERSDPAAAKSACAMLAGVSAPAAGKRKVAKKAAQTSTPADTQCDAPPTRSYTP